MSTMALTAPEKTKSDLNPAESKLLKDQALELWQKRDAKESLEESLSKFEMVHETNPSDIETLEYLSRGYFLLADGHLEDDDMKKNAFDKARTFGEKGLATNPEFKKVMDKEKDIVKAIEVLSKREVPSLLWGAAALGKWAKLNGIFSSLGHKNTILGMVKKVEALDPNYFHGAVPRYWGGFYAVAPSIAGGDMDKSKKYFEEAIAKAPDYLATRVLYAELYCVKKGDKSEFKKQLDFVMATTKSPGDIAPENRIEKKKAQKLLSKMDDLF